ncbi:hypothetical protein V1294_006750 [Bradyrhizobium sp. AZCC 1678]|uniref:hypothetical protein n=1 Tax=Bradyrhizobium sp. AZCC 1678 TaxID=3117030 RepID=UPI002FEF4468
MPNLGQVRMAAYRVMREVALPNITIAAVRRQMVKDGARPGSHRDLPKMIRDFKDEQKDIVRLPLGVVKLTEQFATRVWEIALATAGEMELQRGGAQPEPRVIRKRRPTPIKGTARIVALQKTVEFMLRPDARGSSLIREPVAAIDVYRRLTDKQAELTDEYHISRDLQKIEKQSRLVYRVRDESNPSREGRWWRRDRPLPTGYGDRKVTTRYVPRGTSLSQIRMGNRPLVEDAISFMITSKHPVSRQEIMEALDVPIQQRAKFALMLRNHLRAKNPRFTRDADGNFSVVQRRSACASKPNGSQTRTSSAGGVAGGLHPNR